MEVQMSEYPELRKLQDIIDNQADRILDLEAQTLDLHGIIAVYTHHIEALEAALRERVPSREAIVKALLDNAVFANSFGTQHTAKLLAGHLGDVIRALAPGRRCARCGCTTKGEEALVGGDIWCHPCADRAALAPEQDK
jgi:uncharacterized protein (DUF305 family)